MQLITKVTVLVVDDEPAIRKLVDRGLTGWGYNIILTSSGQEALDIAAQKAPNIILLDISLETEPSGLEVCQKFREWSKTPIIMLTARDEKQMKLAALNAGADDYVTKPFDMEELEARIRAVLRRGAYEGAKSPSGEIQVGDLKIDLVNRRVRVKENEIHLTRREYDLLKILATHPGRVLTFQTLIAEIWGQSASAKAEHNVQAYISSLRKKLKDDPVNTIKPHYIFSELGIGYRFADLEPDGKVI